MASLKSLRNGKYQVQWYDARGVRHRHVVSGKAKASQLFEQASAEKLFETSGLQPALGQKATNLKRLQFQELADRYVKEHLSITRAAGNATYIKTLKAKWGKWRLFQITPEQVRPWLIGFLNGTNGDRQWAVSSVKKLAVYFRRVFSYGCEVGCIASNPLEYLMNNDLKKRFRRVNKRTRTITQEQFWALQTALPLWLRRICICAWSTGMRPGEVINLRWRDVDLVQRLIRFSAEDTKEADFKTVGIDQDLYDVLIEIQTESATFSPDAWVFLSVKGLKVNHNRMNREFRKHADGAGCTALVMHDFRHCFVTRKRRAGHDRSVIKANTGHHSDSMYHWYNAVNDSDIQDLAGFTLERMDDLQECMCTLVDTATDKGIPFEAVVSLMGKMWRQKVLKTGG